MLYFIILTDPLLIKASAVPAQWHSTTQPSLNIVGFGVI